MDIHLTKVCNNKMQGNLAGIFWHTYLRIEGVKEEITSPEKFIRKTLHLIAHTRGVCDVVQLKD